MNKNTNNSISIVWPITLVGLPTSALIIIITSILFGTIEEGENIFFIVMSSAFLFVVFSFFNVAFSIFTIGRFWNALPNRKKVKYSIIVLVVNIISAYPISSLWKKSNVNIYSLKNKKSLSLLALFFYFLISTCFMLSSFLSSVEYGVVS